MGTIPAYLERVDPTQDIMAVIREEILERGSILHKEVEFLLREELREPRKYFVILRAIAQGKRKLAEIINDTSLTKRTSPVTWTFCAHCASWTKRFRLLRDIRKRAAWRSAIQTTCWRGSTRPSSSIFRWYTRMSAGSSASTF